MAAPRAAAAGQGMDGKAAGILGGAAGKPRPPLQAFIRPDIQSSRRKTMNNSAAGLLAGLCSLAAIAGAAQDSGIKREVLQHSDLSVPGREAIVARSEVEPGI